MRVLAVTAPKGGSRLPGVPAVADYLPRMVFESWLGIAASPGTPPAIIERINRELSAVLGQPGVRERLIGFGGSTQASTPAEFKVILERDISSLRTVAQQRKIEAE